MNGMLYRLAEFIHPGNHHVVILDASAGLVLGVVKGLKDFAGALQPMLPTVDGVVCSPGQLRRFANRHQSDAALLVRMEWSNARRRPDFVLPPSETHWVPVLEPREARDLGAVAMVTSLLLGYEEELEATCLRHVAQWAMVGRASGLPLVVEILADGPRVAAPEKAIELGASYALEAGADVIAIPFPGQASLGTLAQFLSVPWLIKPSRLELASQELEEALEHRAAGVWVDHGLFAQSDPMQLLSRLATRSHPAEAAYAPRA